MQYPLYRRLHWSQGWSGQVQKILSQPGFNCQTVQPKVNCSTDYTVLAHSFVCGSENKHISVGNIQVVPWKHLVQISVKLLKPPLIV
jgi:hypothetical protein